MVAIKGVSNKAYVLHAKMLRTILEPIKLPEGIFRLNCQTNIGSLASKLLEAVPCVIDTSICNTQDCPNKKRPHTYLFQLYK